MSEQGIFILIIAIISFDFLFERILEYLNLKNSSKPIPEELQGIYEEEAYQKSQRYLREKTGFSFYTSAFFFILTIAAISLGWFGWLDLKIRAFSQLDQLTTLYFFAILFVVSDILSTPFSLYSTFVIEEKFGFNKTTLKTFILDKFKGYILAILIGGLLLVAFIYLVELMGSNFWIYFWLVMVAFILLANVFYTSWILPLFNKLSPIEEGELKAAITSFSDSVKFPLKNIFVMDGSKRSSKGNAFFSGLGRRKKVVLFDTLINKHSVDELTAVFAHEVGHFKKKHIISSTVLSIVQIGLMLYIMSLMIFSSDLSFAMGGDKTALHLNVLAFGFLYSPISRVLGIGMNSWSRKNEYEADEYAAKHFKAQPLIDALKKMSSDHLSNLTPHPAYVYVNHSHPTLLQRIRAMLGA